MSKLTLDEAIKHCLEVAEDNEAKAQKIGYQFLGTTKDREATECRECAADHRQLAEWLTELKEARAALNDCGVEIEMLLNELREAKRLLRLAVEDFKAVNSNMLTCRYCKHYDAGIDDCGLSDDDSACEDICGWRYADEAQKLLNDKK